MKKILEVKTLAMAKPAPLTPEVRTYMSTLGKIGGTKNILKGSEYFSRISKMKTGMKYKERAKKITKGRTDGKS